MAFVLLATTNYLNDHHLRIVSCGPESDRQFSTGLRNLHCRALSNLDKRCFVYLLAPAAADRPVFRGSRPSRTFLSSGFLHTPECAPAGCTSVPEDLAFAGIACGYRPALLARLITAHDCCGLGGDRHASSTEGTTFD